MPMIGVSTLGVSTEAGTLHLAFFAVIQICITAKNCR
jgi:hypothetical protein